MTKSQVNWAKKHDWFVAYELLSNWEYKVFVNEGLDSNGLLIHPEFTDFQKLRAWAGY